MWHASLVVSHVPVRPDSDFRVAYSWSKNNFLLSSSMDTTVKLWHLSTGKCLRTFVHDDCVTAGKSLRRVVALGSVAIPIANMLTHPARLCPAIRHEFSVS